jgi:histidyl-tRNA synthetase
MQDFDISGTWDPMIPDGEILSLMCTIFSKLDVGEYTIKVGILLYDTESGSSILIR